VTDAEGIERCLALARKAEGTTAPNPIVGGVVVDRRGRVIAEGWHRGPGTLHGEAMALEKAGARAKGATLYVNLEPCNHEGGGRVPCSARVIASGVARVVIGAMDPIKGHAGGARRIARAGISVTTGVLREACEDANAPFFTWARLGRPRFVLKAAATLDGRIATVGGESKWITGEAARKDGRALRGTLDAILVGVGTVLADDPQLTSRARGVRDPVRVVLDGALRTPPRARLLPKIGGSKARTIIACGSRAPDARARALEAAGAEIWRVPAARDGRIDLRALAEKLGAEKLTSVLVEGGGRVHASFLEAGLADEIRLYLAPLIVGGADAPAWVGGAGAKKLADATRLEWLGPPERVGDDLIVRARPVYKRRR
jgi:diaminohydroxyphosphoribosylaminopyrimidine deaminase/5-amino-6-(5-phosphoribosylamino)uracil reductase